MRRASLGVVMVEFTLAAVGLVAIAFMTVRVGQWLNDTMVERNTSFQASRPLAGHGPGVTPFAGPATPLHLIGPHASLTPGHGTPGGGDSTVKPTCGDDLLRDANWKRLEAVGYLINGQAFTLPEQSQITWINAVDWNMLMEANYLAWNAIQIDTWRTDIMNRIYPRLHEIQNMDIVQGSGVYDFCNRSNVPTLSADVVGGISVPAHDLCPLQDPVGIHQIDERLNGIANELNPNVDGTVGDEWDQLNTRKWEIIRELYTLVPPDEDGLGSTLAWRRAATYAAYLQAKQACEATTGGILNGSGTITSCFNPSSPGGIAIDVTPGTEVKASGGGTVSYYQTCSILVCGHDEYTVTIDHGAIDDSGGHLYSIYTHLQSIDSAISSGTVTSGEVLGTGGSIELGYARFVSSPVYFGQYVDPLNGSCSVGMSTDVFEAPLYPDACGEASNLLTQLDGLNSDWDALYADGQAIQTRLDALQPLYNYLVGQLWGLWGPYWEATSGWGLYAQVMSYLDQVDGMVQRWNPLSQELYGHNVWDQDLSDLFRNMIQAWDDANANSDGTVVVEEIPEDLDQIIGRLLQMMLERLDHADWSQLPDGTNYQGQIPQSLRDLFDRFHLPPVSDDSVNPNPVGQRQANALIPPLMEYNEKIRTLILDAEELERRARRECTSAADH